MPSKVKPLKLNDDNESIPFPTEIDPTDDYAAIKGVSFENSDNHLIDKIGDSVQLTDLAVGKRKVVDLMRYAFMMGSG